MELDRRGQQVVYVRCQRGGLANRLFPWARARVYADRFDLPMLGVRWEQLKIGPLIRRERDTRSYVGLLRQESTSLVGARRIERLMTRRRQNEPSTLSCPPEHDQRLVVFTGLKDYFAELVGHQDLLAHCLRAISRDDRLPDPALLLPIVCHVRLSDFGHRATPPQWFAQRIVELRQAGITDQVGVVSDGDDAELKCLTDIPGVRILRTGNALGDLWVAASSSVLLGASSSTFSAWASFLGSQVTVFAKGGNMVGLESRCNSPRHRVIEIANQKSADEFISLSGEALSERALPLLSRLSRSM